MTWAIARGIASSFPRAIVARAPAEPMDVPRARAQHAAYVAALRSCGVRVRELPPDDALPDGCFVEDCALVFRGVALVTYPGAPSRVAERTAVEEALAAVLPVARTEPPATIDGGDCLVVEDRIYVGLSRRTNEAGARRIREVFEPLGATVATVPVPGLHLKCDASYLGRGKLLLSPALPATTFADVDVLAVPEDEAYAANALAIGDRVLVSAGFPRVRELVARAGFEPVPLETTEFRKADGALTCLSVLGG